MTHHRSGTVSTNIIRVAQIKLNHVTLRRHQAFVWPAIKSFIFAHPKDRRFLRVSPSAKSKPCHTLSTLEALEYAQFKPGRAKSMIFKIQKKNLL